MTATVKQADTTAQGSRWWVKALLGAMLAVLAVAAVGLGRWLRPASSPTAADPNLVAAGKIPYVVSCSKCHGPQGHGDGDAAETLRPPPRDFAGSNWRFARTPESIRQVILNGIPGTAMPSYKQTISPQELQAIVAYVEHLANLPADSRVESTTEKKVGLANDTLVQLGFQFLSSPVQASDIELTSNKSNQIRLKELQGHCLLLYFWGTSCEPCLKSLPKLAELQRELHSHDIQIVPICVDGKETDDFSELVSQLAPNLIAWYDARGTAPLLFDAQTLPTIWLVDPSGNLVAKGIGSLNWEEPSLKTALIQWAGTSSVNGQE